MNEDEELKTQCFGGDYMGEVFDNNLKRMQFRRQKRWWNAYMLFYTRCDQKFAYNKSTKEQLSLAESRQYILSMPEPIERSVRIQNIKFLHSRSIFTIEFFNFIRKLVSSSAQPFRIDKLVNIIDLFFVFFCFCNLLGKIINLQKHFYADTSNGRVIFTWHATWFTIFISYWTSYQKSHSRSGS